MTYKFSILLALCFFCSITSALSQPVEFVENKGQWDNRVKFMGTVNGGAFFVQQDGFTVLQHSPEDWGKLRDYFHGQQEKSFENSRKLPVEGIAVRSHAYKVAFVGGNSNAPVIADKPLPGVNNYFIGNDPSKWASDAKIFQGITVRNIYPNIDVRYYSSPGSVKYDIIVHPGGNPADIALQYEGAEGLEIKNKELIIKTSVGDLKELNPYTYQYNPV